MSLFFPCSRKKRQAVEYNFEPKHIIIINIEVLSDAETAIELFVLDPTSTSLIPDSAFSSEQLKKMIIAMYSDGNKYLSFPLKSVDKVSPPQASTGGDKESSKAPVVAGVIIALLVLVCVVIAVWFYLRRRKHKRCVVF